MSLSQSLYHRLKHYSLYAQASKDSDLSVFSKMYLYALILAIALTKGIFMGFSTIAQK